MRSLVILISCLAALAFGTSATRAADMYWQFNPQRQTAQIFIEGRIENGDEVRFRAMVLEVIERKLPPEDVTIFSQGGAVQPALEIGRQIRLLKVGTVAPVRVPEPCLCR